MKSDSLSTPHYCAVLKQSALFMYLNEKALSEIVEILSRKKMTLPKGSPAEEKFHTLNYFYVIVSGRVKVSKINPESGREFAFLLLGPGDVFDVICLLDEQEHPVQIDILEDVEILYVLMQEVRFWIQNHSELNKTLLPYLGDQMRRLEDLAADLATRDTATRLARLILHHTSLHPFPKNGIHPVRLIHDLTHDLLAQMIGSTRQVVNQHLQALRREGILDARSKHLAVKELSALKEKADNCLSNSNHNS